MKLSGPKQCFGLERFWTGARGAHLTETDRNIDETEPADEWDNI